MVRFSFPGQKIRLWKTIFVGHGFSRDINASLGPALAADAFVGVPKLQGLKPNYSSRYCRS
jgi:hypothetical protein